jgi:hypothetical protein
MQKVAMSRYPDQRTIRGCEMCVFGRCSMAAHLFRSVRRVWLAVRPNRRNGARLFLDGQLDLGANANRRSRGATRRRERSVGRPRLRHNDDGRSRPQVAPPDPACRPSPSPSPNPGRAAWLCRHGRDLPRRRLVLGQPPLGTHPPEGRVRPGATPRHPPLTRKAAQGATDRPLRSFNGFAD